MERLEPIIETKRCPNCKRMVNIKDTKQCICGYVFNLDI